MSGARLPMVSVIKSTSLSNPVNGMTMEQTKEYPFTFYDKWLNYGARLDDIETQWNFYKAIVAYGVYEKEPKGLDVCDLAFFNRNIRPVIDRQHKKYDLKHNGK